MTTEVTSHAAATEITVTQARDDLAAAISRAQYGDGITYMTRHGKRTAAIVPAHVAEWLEKLQDAEDAEDARDARQALAEIAAGAKTTPWAKLRAEMAEDGVKNA
jgi:antitoxin Phd